MPSFCDGIFAFEESCCSVYIEGESRTTGMEGGCRMLFGIIDAEYIVESERIVRSSYDLSEHIMG